MKIVTKEDVLDLFTNVFSEEDIKTTQIVFMVDSTDELVLALVKYINSQSRRAITSSLVVSRYRGCDRTASRSIWRVFRRA